MLNISDYQDQLLVHHCLCSLVQHFSQYYYSNPLTDLPQHCHHEVSVLSSLHSFLYNFQEDQRAFQES